MHADRERLRATFDSAARLYDAARPNYPAELFDDLVRLAKLRPGDRLLEIGCGAGKATIPLARRGFRITGVELGEELGGQARLNLAGFAGVQIMVSAFELWRPPAGATYDLVFAATSWHWVDPTVRYRRAWELLRPGGPLAFWSASHVFPADGDPFFGEIQDVYDAIGEGLPPGSAFLRPGELPDQRDEIEACGLFSDTQIRHFDWEVSYDAEGYIRLLETFSGHIAMEERKRDRLYGEIRRRLAGRPDGRLRRHWGAVLHVTTRRDGAGLAGGSGTCWGSGTCRG
jgi:SAM-dependent methyltransferase